MTSGGRVPEPDRYRLIRQLGRGGMVEVFLARDLTLGREVAIKFLASEPGHVTKKRLLHEAQSAASLDHPNICTVYEVGETPDGRGFIVMQFVEGETLASRLERGPLPVREVLALGAHVTDALAAAHRHGIVHRDLKPQNVIVTPSGRPKLVDFGLAKILPMAADAEASTHSLETVAGVLKGTPACMSPEQVQQHPVDGRSDLFALGSVLFECFTGTRSAGRTPSTRSARSCTATRRPPRRSGRNSTSGTTSCAGGCWPRTPTTVSSRPTRCSAPFAC